MYVHVQFKGEHCAALDHATSMYYIVSCMVERLRWAMCWFLFWQAQLLASTMTTTGLQGRGPAEWFMLICEGGLPR